VLLAVFILPVTLYSTLSRISANNYTDTPAKKVSESLKLVFDYPLYIHFAASWCPTCMDELPGILAYFELNKDERLIFILKNDTKENFISKSKIFAELLKLDNVVIRNEADDILFTVFRESQLPVTVYFYSNSNEYKKVVGKMDWKNIHF
jgi:thiol-disulfide isomerase/thioredoxin